MIEAPRTHRRQLAELAYVVRAVVNEIEAGGGPIRPAHYDALNLVDAFVAGGKPTKTALRAARDAVAAIAAKYGVGSPPYEKATYWLPLVTLLAMVESGKDMSHDVLTHANYAVPTLDWGGRTKRIDELRAEARAACGAITDEPIAKPTKRVNARVAAREAELLATSRRALHPTARALLDRLGAARDEKRLGAKDKLAALLRRLGLPVSEAVLRFEEAFGGLLLVAGQSEDWREEGSWTLVGPWACLRSGWTVTPRGGRDQASLGLVLVAQGPNDDHYYLDPEGRPYYHESIGEPSAVPFGLDAADLVFRLVMGLLLFGGAAPATLVPLAPRSGADAAAGLNVPLLSSDEHTRWWASPDAIVLDFRDATYAAGFTPIASTQLARRQ